MANETYDIGQVIGKDLFAKVSIAVRKYADDKAPKIRNVSSGERVGTVYSYVERGGVIWWQLKDKGFVKHGPGRFDLNALRDQGAKSNKEIQQEKVDENKTNIEKGVDSVLGGAKKIAVWGIALFIGYKVINYASTKK